MESAKKIIAVFCIIAIICNVAIGYNSYNGAPKSTIKFEKESRPQPNENMVVIVPDFSVIVPAHKLWEIVRYDQNIFAEFYEINKSSGEYGRITLNAGGEVVDKMLGVSKKTDGFGDTHNTICFNEDVAGSFTLGIEESGGVPLIVKGSFDSKRFGYTDLTSWSVIQSIVNGSIHVEDVPYINIPLDYSGNLRDYPDPNAPKVKTIEESIYGDNKTLKFGDNGTVYSGDETGEIVQNYTWVIDGANKISEYDTLKINVTSKMVGAIDFNRIMWISNKVPILVKGYSRTNATWNERESEGYVIVETWRTIKEGGFIEGTEDIPWGACDSFHFASNNSRGEYQEYEYMPNSGTSFERSSFNFKPEDAVKCAIDNSEGLRAFLNKYEGVCVDSAVYNSTKDNQDKLDPEEKAGTYYWNLTFARTMMSPEEANRTKGDSNRSYNVLVEHVIKKTVLQQYTESTTLAQDNGLGHEPAALSRQDLLDKLLTLTGSETIFKLDSEIRSKAFDSRTDKIDFKDTTFAIVMGGTTPTGPIINMVGILTGVTVPTSRYSYFLQKSTVYERGETFSAAVDVETGRLIYTLEVKGTALFGLL
ncbi:MAG: hypothetical protein WC974_05025 [Thermoplasmata archaeon]